ncbi:O-methyltransferase [Acetonema longum]|uniref:O-methyltransferase family 3 n=1 Tax=Acetonema longum DSM 6540 TaxID=1009370 RepID=F7NI84_9FIRM|nr:O-methyltransferase [Acetonema longum]EGO64249.1 O-methyltransferase family 3 [Acetonema longum DSM 6540]
MTDIASLLTNIRRYAQDTRVPILAAASEQVLIEVILAQKPARILEIGTAIGYSALLMAAHMPASGRIITIEKDAGRIILARQFIHQAGIDYENRITLVEGDAAQIIPGIAGPFDLVFIDAAKAQYYNYLTAVLTQLSPRAAVVADNVLFRGIVLDGQPPRRFRTIATRMKQYLDFVSRDPRFQTEIRAAGDGLSISYYQGDLV